ncbi:MAG: methyltransferase domain-containing protein [Rhizobiales bacterium]|nr:methyltransferase domain-containing protein [Hyphomicrobiales bacterium]
MSEASASSELYHDGLIGMLEAVWGEGFLSPGGPEEVARIIAGLDLAGLSILDIGCGSGGIDCLLVETHGAGFVTGIDVEDTVLNAARQRAEKKGLSKTTGFLKMAPRPASLRARNVRHGFSKDSIVHIPDKHALARDVFRVLRPGGWFAASDWLIGHDGEPSPAMKVYIAAEGLDFGMASPAQYQAALEAAGFTNISITSRNAWYRETAKAEIARMRGPLYADAVRKLGKDFVDHNIDIWEKMLPVLDSGEHCPTHLRGRKP